MSGYAQFNEDCINSTTSIFLQYLPFLLLIEAVIIVMVEKFFVRIPQVGRKMDRFYHNIVEEALFGKDPDVAEDVCDDKANTEAISRKRRRNEVCNALKRSSVIYYTYQFKNILEIVLMMIFIPLNFVFNFKSMDSLEPTQCVLPIHEVIGDGSVYVRPGLVYYECEGKKVEFFIVLCYFQIACQALCFTCSAGSLIWFMYYRSISSMAESFKQLFKEECSFETTTGKDFFFLFDLLAHSSGFESTLRVITHADDTFKLICQPRIRASEKEYIKVTF